MVTMKPVTIPILIRCQMMKDWEELNSTDDSSDGEEDDLGDFVESESESDVETDEENVVDQQDEACNTNVEWLRMSLYSD